MGRIFKPIICTAVNHDVDWKTPGQILRDIAKMLRYRRILLEKTDGIVFNSDPGDPNESYQDHEGNEEKGRLLMTEI